MNTNKTLSTAIPYIILALVFVALVQLAEYGFMTSLESQVLATADQLTKGADIYACDWGRTAACALVLQPLYTLATTLCGGCDGVVYVMRVVFVAIDFAVALAAYRLLSSSLNRLASLLTALAYFVLANSTAVLLGPYGAGLTCAFLAGLFVRSTYLAALEDDGTSTGYLRVLRPVLGGFLIACAGLFSGGTGVACLIMLVIAWIYVKDADDMRLRAPIAWMLCGAVLAAACYLLLALGYGELGAVVGSLISSERRAHLGTGLVCEFGVFALLSVLAASTVGEEAKTSTTLAAMALALALIGAAIQLSGSAALALVDDVHIQEGPAQDLVCTSEDVQVYDDACELAQKADSDDVYVAGGDDASWAYLLLDGQRSDNEPEWVLKVGSSDGVRDALVMQNCGKVAGNATCELYHRASAIASISQG